MGLGWKWNYHYNKIKSFSPGIGKCTITLAIISMYLTIQLKMKEFKKRFDVFVWYGENTCSAPIFMTHFPVFHHPRNYVRDECLINVCGPLRS